MNDWAAPLIAAALFAFLSPGLVVQMPAKNRAVDFLNMKTSIAAIFVHTVLYGCVWDSCAATKLSKLFSTTPLNLF
ncbi:hypothetical protein CICLE_v10018377mg [Citrus x clementina]|uniref:Uncharacterized protein n=2 Tax=Citrus TaxID=2706 RepID=A0A067F936_CITSI|nr:hypothetical protein CICLE_v10018377mg [Citrus x clementina]KDO63904.1 hypothetical protein CISIN_1g035029mg [Citrus sinensis]